MNIVYSSDDNYARHLAASMTSLLDNNRAAPEIHVWILNVGLSEDNIRKLTQTAERFGRTIHIVDGTIMAPTAAPILPDVAPDVASPSPERQVITTHLA